ncbi:MAG: integrase arm-type DNA-binding domain-containing protein [Hyphomicrobiales bacterium]|nr:integrase arm-type DNA-binding domain-containing protein [Hyphomicrobiales bacterium]MDE2114775.1 integrase arm-type DNA-binding domain-containing protein [Hyphomicrobiales bacterium]
MGKLTNAGVLAAKTGKIGDGDGLWLVTSKTGRKSWVLRFKIAGKSHEHGLGAFPVVGLKEARERALDGKRLISAGSNPIIEHRIAQGLPASTGPTFGQCADDFITRKAPGWRNAKHAAQWRSTLLAHASTIQSTPVDEVTTKMVVHLLTPIWSTIPETASRLRGRIEQIIGAAKMLHPELNWQGENPARWTGHLEHILPAPKKLSRGHHDALPYSDLPSFMANLRKRGGMAALALEFTILTAARSGEIRGATWQEMDLERALWTVPASRMKSGREHCVPLSAPALKVLDYVKDARTGDLVFPGLRGGTLSDASLLAVLRRMEVEATAHGFRSSFRDWVANETEFARELAEESLAHVIASKVEAAYRRGSAIEKRRVLMNAWAQYCDSAVAQPQNIVRFRR